MEIEYVPTREILSNHMCKAVDNVMFERGTFLSYIEQNEFKKKNLYREWTKNNLLKHSISDIVFLFANSPIKNKRTNTFLQVIGSGSRSVVDLTFLQNYGLPFEEIQNYCVESLFNVQFIQKLPMHYTYTPIVTDRVSVATIVMENSPMHELFINPIGYFTFPDTIRVKSNKGLCYFEGYTFTKQDILVFAFQMEVRVQEHIVQRQRTIEEAHRNASKLMKQENAFVKNKVCCILDKYKSKFVEPVEPVVEPVVESVESVPLNIIFKIKTNPDVTTLLYQSYNNKGAMYDLIVNKDILVVSDIHHNYIPEKYKHFGIRLSDGTTTSFTYHCYVNDTQTQIIYYTSVLRVYD